jgi:hypothetical protein
MSASAPSKRAPEDPPAAVAAASAEPATPVPKKAKLPDYMKFGGRREPRVGEAFQATLPSPDAAAVDAEGEGGPDENEEPPPAPAEEEEAPAVAQIEESE